jgi:hypothetical protein
MPTNRELALEAAVRFTDRAKYTTEVMLKNAGEIEKWLNRDLPKPGQIGGEAKEQKEL